MGALRVCSVCRRELPGEAFQRVAPGQGRSDGLSSDCRACRSERKRRDREKRAAAEGKAYRTAAEVRAAVVERAAARRAESKARGMLWGTKIVEHVTPERSRQITARARVRRARDPAYREALNAKKRARYAAVGPGYARDRELVAERDGWTCAICHGLVTRADWSLDHIVPLSDGGAHALDNVVLAHKRCNSWRGQGDHPIPPPPTPTPSGPRIGPSPDAGEELAGFD